MMKAVILKMLPNSSRTATHFGEVIECSSTRGKNSNSNNCTYVISSPSMPYDFAVAASEVNGSCDIQLEVGTRVSFNTQTEPSFGVVQGSVTVASLERGLATKLVEQDGKIAAATAASSGVGGPFFSVVKVKQEFSMGMEEEEEHMRHAEIGEDEIGSWAITGSVSFFFDPQLIVKYVTSWEELSNHLPPLLQQGNSFELQLWAMFPVEKQQLSLRILSEEGTDVTEMVAETHLEVHACEYVTLDSAENVKYASFTVTLKNFEMESTHAVVTFQILSKFGRRRLKLHSTPLLVQKILTGNANNGAAVNSNEDGVPGKVTGCDGNCDPVSYKFWTRDFLEPVDHVDFGFFDPGRSNPLVNRLEEYNKQPMSEREVLLIPKGDKKLERQRKVLQRMTACVLSAYAKATTILWFVGNVSGGQDTAEKADESLKMLRKSLTSRKRGRETAVAAGGNVVNLSQVPTGLCRHRALLFKFFCDFLSVPCYLIRGTVLQDGVEERHTWAVVRMGRMLHLADPMLHPECLKSWPDSNYSSKESPPMWKLGDEITNCLTLGTKIVEKEECGRGASAIVRRVTFGGLSCAVKIAKTQKEVDGLVREFNILRDFVSCPHIVSSYGWHNGIVMEYCPITLLGFMNMLILRQRAISLQQLHSVLIGMLSALKKIHEKGLVHRDVKAENVLVYVLRCRNCLQLGVVCQACEIHPLLADFADCCKVGQDNIATDATRVGTVPYVAPEILAKKPFSFAADMWSLGILAAELNNMKLPSVKNPDANDAVVPVSSSAAEGAVVVPALKRRRDEPLPEWLTRFREETLVIEWEKRKTAAEILSWMMADNPKQPK